MTRIFTLVVMLVVVLSACSNNVKSNTISASDLTEKESGILKTISDQSFVFDYTIDDDYKEVSVWVEKYESGKLVEDTIGSLITDPEKKGSIIFATSSSDNNNQEQILNIGMIGNDGITSVSNVEIKSDDFNRMSSVWGNLQGENKSIEDELVLAHISYSKDEVMSSLTTDFYEDPEGHMNELKQYDLVYLLKAEFIK